MMKTDPILLSMVWLPLALVIAFLLTGRVRRYALARSIVDIPNQRSSHEVPTPRGGGLAIVLVFLATVVLSYLSGFLSGRMIWALGAGGFVVALVGWLDDRRSLPVKIRVAAQFLAAALAVTSLNGFDSLDIGWYKVELGVAGPVLAVVGVVWMVNLYNFMDGIDGIAGVEAITTGLIAGMLLIWKAAWGFALLSFVLAFATAGFLIWNWPPAKIFMGDVGSGFLGYVFAVMALATDKAGVLPLLVWILLLGVFVCDASVTLAMRLKRQEKVWKAHRSHFYQRAVQVGYSHKSVTSCTFMLNVLLGLLAALAVMSPCLLLPSIAAGAMLLAAAGLLVVRLEKIRTHETPAAK